MTTRIAKVKITAMVGGKIEIVNNSKIDEIVITANIIETALIAKFKVITVKAKVLEKAMIKNFL